MNTSDWANAEFNGVDLGDKRLNERLVKITGQFISSTESPINQACGGWAETKAVVLGDRPPLTVHRSIPTFARRRTFIITQVPAVPPRHKVRRQTTVYIGDRPRLTSNNRKLIVV